MSHLLFIFWGISSVRNKTLLFKLAQRNRESLWPPLVAVDFKSWKKSGGEKRETKRREEMWQRRNREGKSCFPCWWMVSINKAPPTLAKGPVHSSVMLTQIPLQLLLNSASWALSQFLIQLLRSYPSFWFGDLGGAQNLHFSRVPQWCYNSRPTPLWGTSTLEEPATPASATLPPWAQRHLQKHQWSLERNIKIQLATQSTRLSYRNYASSHFQAWARGRWVSPLQNNS